jgi:hypothetical protein
LTRENIAFLGFIKKFIGKIKKNITHTHHKHINHITNKLLSPRELMTFMPMSEIQKILLEHIKHSEDNTKHHIIFTGFDVNKLKGTANLIIDCTGNRDKNISIKFANEETVNEKTLSKLVGTTDIQVKKKTTETATETATETELQYNYKFNYLLYICKTNLNKKLNKKCSRVILKTNSPKSLRARDGVVSLKTSSPEPRGATDPSLPVTSAQAIDGGIDWYLEEEAEA